MWSLTTQCQRDLTQNESAQSPEESCSQDKGVRVEGDLLLSLKWNQQLRCHHLGSPRILVQACVQGSWSHLPKSRVQERSNEDALASHLHA